MNAKQWGQVDRIFQEAIDRAPRERTRFIEQACAGDISLRKEVEALIIAHEQAGSFMEGPGANTIHAARVTIGAGTRFGAYEILSPLGAGGMGEVYCAHDTKLKRNVALKILPELFASDKDRLLRFKREAQMLASLNHPNIGAIYGLEESEGRMALVLELIEGPTLADRIARGPISFERALPIARQIAEALEAAHERGVIHRDLKPANIKITSDDKVKVLDFGLAKMKDPAGLNADPANAQTEITETLPGMIIGTAAYMSPEQAKGKDADRTSDIWAFGCVFYEMLTGRRPFGGETLTDILSSVLKEEPDWNVLPKNTPPGIRRLLGRCLQKDRKNRLHEIADARILIEDTAGEHEATTPSRQNWARPLPIALIALAFAALFLGGLYLRSPREAPEVRVEINTPPTTSMGSFAISPNGRELAFVATFENQPRLYLRSLELNDAELLPGTEDASDPFWSPDNQSIGFYSGRDLKRFDVAGRVVQTVTNAPGDLALLNPYGAAWNVDGTIVFGPNYNTPLYRVSEKGGVPVPATHLDPPRQTVHWGPKFLPDGQHFLLFASGNSEGRGVYVGSLLSLDVRHLFDSNGPAVFVAPGYLLYVRLGVLLSQRFDARKLEPEGNPTTVAESANFVSASANVIAYRAQAPSVLIRFDRSGKAMSTIDKENGGTPEISPDGNWVAVIKNVDDNIDVWILDAARGVSNRLTVDPAVDGFPIWSPDSKRVLFGSEKGHTSRQDLYSKSADGNSEATLLVASEGKWIQQPLAWSPDGRTILFQRRDFQRRDPENVGSLYALTLTVDGKPAGDPVPLAKNNTTASDSYARFSPDGRWIAFESNRSGKNEIYVQPFPGPGPAKQISIGGGSQVRWPRNAKELFYVEPDGKLIALPVVTSADGRTFNLGTPANIAPKLRIDREILRQNYDISSDGQQILMYATPEDQLTPPITLILNWKPPAK